MARFLVNVQLDLFRSAVIYTHCYLLFAAALLHLCSGSVNNTGTPLPAVCGEKRGDRTVPNTVSSICEVKVQRYFFHRDKHCKKFSLCQSTATYLDGQADPNINYFRNMADCRQACTDGEYNIYCCNWHCIYRHRPAVMNQDACVYLHVASFIKFNFTNHLSVCLSVCVCLCQLPAFSHSVVECLHQPLEMENGYPVTLTGEEGVWGEIREGEKLGYGTTVRFECNEGYRLVEEENVHFCELNGTWSGEQPDCESEPNTECLVHAVHPNCTSTVVIRNSLLELSHYRPFCSQGNWFLTEFIGHCLLASVSNIVLGVWCIN